MFLFSSTVLVREIPAALGGEIKHRKVEYDVAQRLRMAGYEGSIAEIGRYRGEMSVGRGLFVAFFLDVPWYGRQNRARPQQLKATGASLMILPRGSKMESMMDQDRHFVSLDGKLYKSSADAERCPLKAYRSSSGRH